MKTEEQVWSEYARAVRTVAMARADAQQAQDRVTAHKSRAEATAAAEADAMAERGRKLQTRLNALDVLGHVLEPGADGNLRVALPARELPCKERQDPLLAFQHHLPLPVWSRKAGGLKSLQCLSFRGEIPGKIRSGVSAG